MVQPQLHQLQREYSGKQIHQLQREYIGKQPHSFR